MYKYLLCLLLASCLLLCGCNSAKELGKTLGDLAKVRAELINKFGEKDINIRVNTFQHGTNISVVYANSPLNSKTMEERAKRAQETAEIVRQHYPAIKNINEIWVAFVRVTTRLVVLHWSEMVDARGFDNEARPLRDFVNTPSKPDQPEVWYSEKKNQTDISSGVLQLEGTPEKGVIVAPHFSVAGDVNKIKPEPPDEVLVDFAAYSEKPKFPNLTKIVFLADNKIVYQTEDQFSTSKVADDLYSEFLYMKVPTPQFLKIAAGTTIKIKLNEREYTLTENQVLRIKRMSDYLR